MNCPRCEHGIKETARYCEQCGAVLREDDPMHYLARAYRLEAEGEAQKAIAEFEWALENEAAAEYKALIHKHVGNLHFRLGHLRRAMKHLIAACELEPTKGAVWHDLGVVQYHMADFAAAITSLRQALTHDPNLQLAYFWLGNALYHRGLMDEAEEAFQELLSRFPNFTVGHFHLGVIHERRGRHDAAREEFRRVLVKSPEDAPTLHYLRQNGEG